MESLYTTKIDTDYGEKTIEVYNCDILKFDDDIDILTTSAFWRSYIPTPASLFGALYEEGISAEKLAVDPYIDLRKASNVWLSTAIRNADIRIHRLGCIEIEHSGFHEVDKQKMLRSFRDYFRMLDIAQGAGVKMDTVVLPLIGTGDQQLDASLILTPIIRECVLFLKSNPGVQRLIFIERMSRKCGYIVDTLKNSYSLLHERTKKEEPRLNTEENKMKQAFISYSSKDKNIADNLCSKLERKGIKVWYAPRDTNGPYAAAIVKGIKNSDFFIVILSHNSLKSEHVLNEIDVACNRLSDGIKFKPLRINDIELNESFEYYLSRHHWMDAVIPPVEKRLEEFTDMIVNDEDL